MARKIETSFTSKLSSVLEDNKNDKAMFSVSKCLSDFSDYFMYK